MMKRLRNDKLRLPVRLPRKLSSVEDSRLAKYDWRAVAKLARYVDAFTSPAPYVIDNINDATHNGMEKRGFVVPNGVNDVFARAERIRDSTDTLRFLSCGRLDPEKRVDIIIKAFAALPAADVELYILGSGTEEANLKRLAHDLHPKNRIEFLGHYEDHERVANEFANSDVFVFSSYRFDTQGMVLGEAASAGAAIIYCDDRLTVGVDSHNSLLVNNSATAFTAAMRRLMTDRDLLRRMQRASKLLIPQLTADEMCNKFLHVYRSVLPK